jgi:hypothetical protein
VRFREGAVALDPGRPEARPGGVDIWRSWPEPASDPAPSARRGLFPTATAARPGCRRGARFAFLGMELKTDARFRTSLEVSKGLSGESLKRVLDRLSLHPAKVSDPPSRARAAAENARDTGIIYVWESFE